MFFGGAKYFLLAEGIAFFQLQHFLSQGGDVVHYQAAIVQVFNAGMVKEGKRAISSQLVGEHADFTAVVAVVGVPQTALATGRKWRGSASLV